MNTTLCKAISFVCLLSAAQISFAKIALNDSLNEREQGTAIAVAADQVDDNFGDSEFNMTMIIRNKNNQEYKRELDVKNLEVDGDGNKTLIVFQSPADQKGTALLTHSHKKEADDQMIYLPDLKRVKRIASANRSGPFAGSEFAYEDITYQEVDKYSYVYLGVENLNGQDHYKVERIPNDKYSGYKRQFVWYHTGDLFISKVEYFDKKDELLKTLTFEGYKKYSDRYWRADKAIMQNHQTGKSTELIADNWKFKTGMSEASFERNALYRLQ